MVFNSWEKQVQDQSPYHFQRQWDAIYNMSPRQAQPNTSQPNQKFNTSGWGMTSREYWNSVFKNYLKRKQTGSELTNLALGKLVEALNREV